MNITGITVGVQALTVSEKFLFRKGYNCNNS